MQIPVQSNWEGGLVTNWFRTTVVPFHFCKMESKHFHPPEKYKTVNVSAVCVTDLNGLWPGWKSWTFSAHLRHLTSVKVWIRSNCFSRTLHITSEAAALSRLLLQTDHVFGTSSHAHTHTKWLRTPRVYFKRLRKVISLWNAQRVSCCRDQGGAAAPAPPF